MKQKHRHNRRKRSLVGKLKRAFVRPGVLVVAVSLLRFIYWIAKLLDYL